MSEHKGGAHAPGRGRIYGSITDTIGDTPLVRIDKFAEAKGVGFDPKIMRMIVRLRKMETHTRQEQDAVLETYRNALGLA